MDNCFNCGDPGKHVHGYTICDSCLSKLKLFTDQTIQKHSVKNPEAYKKDIESRIAFIDKDYIKKRIKLLHILDRLHGIKKKM